MTRRLLGYIAITWIFWQAIFNNKQAYIYSFFCVTYISLGMKKCQNFLCLSMYRCRLCIQYKVSFSDINV